jgi:hypothetical protein
MLKNYKIDSPQHFVLDEKDEGESFFDKFGNFDQLTINDYNPGDGIPPHIDSHSPFEDVRIFYLGLLFVISTIWSSYVFFP